MGGLELAYKGRSTDADRGIPASYGGIQAATISGTLTER